MSPSVLSGLLATESARDNFVDLEVKPIAWVILGVTIMVMLAVDLFRHREDHAPTPRQATLESLGWVACGLGASAAIFWVWGGDAWGEYISGYLIEKSLSVDNVFVWSIIFSTMAIPLKFQHRVLFWGVFGALVLRLIFILVGTALINRFFWLLIVFGVFLIFTGVKIFRHTEDEGEGGATAGLGLLQKVMPVTERFDGHKFFTLENGKRAATPLFAALVVVEVTDVIFALDSVPAVLAVSKEPFIVFASNAFAILGLRAMYFLLANARERFHYLSHGLGAILVFVGIKMSVSHWYHLDTRISLGVIVLLLIGAIVLSERRAKRLGIAGLGHDGHDGHGH
ncbi:MAG: TerC family protein [Actinomycetota bacterium]|nr:TerC family protein [Actinomycetota bacterium]